MGEMTLKSLKVIRNNAIQEAILYLFH